MVDLGKQGPPAPTAKCMGEHPRPGETRGHLTHSEHSSGSGGSFANKERSALGMGVPIGPH